jgi:two-component system KDP operon response regulator KdpE
MYALLVCPDSDEAAILTVVLQRTGFSIRPARSLERAILAWPSQPSDLILLATAKDGFSLSQIQQLRGQTTAPFILITDSIREEEEVSLLEAGVDLVLPRPFSARLLIARVRALLRRTGDFRFFSMPTLSKGDVTLDPTNRSVQVKGSQPQHLTQLEFRLLYTLMIHAGQVISTETLVENVWGYGGEGNSELVRGLVKRLRSKVEPDPRAPRYIRTESGVGYYFERDKNN